MKFLRTIRLFYLVYTLYTILIILCSNYPVRYAISGLIAMWGIYLVFFLGYRSIYKRMVLTASNSVAQKRFFMSTIADWKFGQYLASALSCWVCAILAAKYYTGKSFSSFFSNFMGGDRAYQSYQQYFANNNIAAFSFEKIPYIIMLTYMTIMLFWSVVSILQLSKNIRFVHWFYLASVMMSYFYFGTMRGTNFELYIIFILIAYCLLNKKNGEFQNKISTKAMILVAIFGVIMVSMFITVVQARGGSFSYKICGEIQYQPDKFLSSLMPDFMLILKSFFSYLGFGIYTMGVTILDIIPSSVSSILCSFFPAYEIFNGESIMFQLKNQIEIGVRWIPDITLLLNEVGLILTIVIIYLIGKLTAWVQTQSFPLLLVEVFGFLIYIQMLSFPVGNFLGTSTPNKLSVIFILICMFRTKFVFSIK